ncbi:MAG: hypothetical protein D6719_07745 [Candidatus Dadabacteria bacterium]|nr:MAG: hypothetical protein D6719_07745 [Candidatus Dadabacteria bacterium]
MTNFAADRDQRGRYPQIANELNAMAEVDQAMRESFRNGAPWDFEVDRKNTKRLKEIIEELGN